MLEPLIRAALRARSRPRVMALEHRIRSAVPALNRAAKSAYARYKRRQLVDASTDPAVRAAMLGKEPLPDGYGRGMDERIVEYPWVLARVPERARRVLDAGSTLNYDWVAEHPAVRDREVICYTLAPEGVLGRPNYSYLYGDLRHTLLRDACVDAVVCISTLEHVGMDNRGYTGRQRDAERDPTGQRDVVRELRRVLVPGGDLLLTVPFGRPQDVGWLLQFDRARLDAVLSAFDGELRRLDFFRHDAGRGWLRATAAECVDAGFVHRVDERTGLATATMATAIACAHLVRPGA